MPRSSQQAEVDRYLRTGEHNGLSPNWPGASFLARAQYADAAVREALVATVLRRTAGAVGPEALAGIDLPVFTRAKLAPMVRGLFAEQAQATVLDVLERSVAFLTPATIGTVLLTTPWLRTVWDLANLYLLSCGVKPLSKDARFIVGLSAETTCFVAVLAVFAATQRPCFFCRAAVVGSDTSRLRTDSKWATRWKPRSLNVSFSFSKPTRV